MKKAICIVLAITTVLLMSGCCLPAELLEKMLPPFGVEEHHTVPQETGIAPLETEPAVILTEPTVIATEPVIMETEPFIVATSPTADEAASVDTLMDQLAGHWVCWYDGAYIFSFDFENNKLVTGFYQSEAMVYKIKNVTWGADNVLVLFTYRPESEENYGLEYDDGDYVFTVVLEDGQCSISCNGQAPLTCQFAGSTYDELYAYCEQFYR